MTVNRADTNKFMSVRFNKDFTVSQFFGGIVEQERRDFDIQSVNGQEILYLRIPKNLQIDDRNLNIQIIGE